MNIRIFQSVINVRFGSLSALYNNSGPMSGFGGKAGIQRMAMTRYQPQERPSFCVLSHVINGAK